MTFYAALNGDDTPFSTERFCGTAPGSAEPTELPRDGRCRMAQARCRLGLGIRPETNPPRRGGKARRRASQLNPMGTIEQRHDSQRIRQWLFAVLRFSITREQHDRAVALAVAAEMDGGPANAASGFTFFVGTTAKLCDAINAKLDPEASPE